MIHVYNTGTYYNKAKLTMDISNFSFDISSIQWKRLKTPEERWSQKYLSYIFPQSEPYEPSSKRTKYIGRTKIFEDGTSCKVIGLDETGWLICDFGNKTETLSLNWFLKKKGHLVPLK